MNNIIYVTGDATQPQDTGPQIILHLCNDCGRWKDGFVIALSQRYSEPEQAYRRWYAKRRSNNFALGAVQFVAIAEALWVANLIGQQGIWQEGGPAPIRYEALQQGLLTVAHFARQTGASIHAPRLGAGRAGGNWNRIAAMLQETLTDTGIAVTIYDLPDTLEGTRQTAVTD